MYEKLESYFSHEDSRGSILGVLNSGNWKELNFISSQAGTVRGGHYHKQTKECFFVISGLIEVTFSIPTEEQFFCEVKTFSAGDAFLVSEFVQHTFRVINDSKWINLLSKPIDKKNPDFFKY
jgi:dTDP-4-dehydrorhamnose 3,5-epimerase-like enzyme